MADQKEFEWLTLDEGEGIVWSGEPRLKSIIPAVIFGIPMIAAAGIGILIILGAYYSVKNTDYVVTNQSLYAKSGVLSTNIETVDIDKIQNTEYNQSFWGKQFDYANIDISTAGSSGAEITFQSIRNARAVRERISELGNRARSGRGSGAADADGTAPRDDRLDELIAELRATREAMERIEAKIDATDRTGVRDDAVESTSRDDAP